MKIKCLEGKGGGHVPWSRDIYVKKMHMRVINYYLLDILSKYRILK